MTNYPFNSPPQRVTEAAQLILDRIGIVANPYFSALNSGRMSREVFGRTQQQFYFAVYEFPRPMLALMTRVDDPAERLGMLDNILEEHGGFDHARFHATSFRLFCERLGRAPWLSR